MQTVKNVQSRPRVEITPFQYARIKALDDLKTAYASEVSDRLQKKLEDLFRSKAATVTKREREFWEAEQNKVESTLDRLESYLTTIVDRLQAARKRLAELVERFAAINLHFQDMNALQKAERVRMVIAQVVFHFGKVPMDKMDRIRQVIAEMPNASSKMVSERLAETGFIVPTKTVATVRKRMENGVKSGKRFHYPLDRWEVVPQSSLITSLSKTR